jgi:hypothetical protein
MTWSDFYLVCFLVGLILSAVSFLFGSAHLHFPHHGGGAHLHLGHGHAPHPHLGKGGMGQRGTDVSFFNFGTATAFLAWFGGAGFLLTRYSSIWVWWALTGAVLAGLAGAAVVFWFVAKLLMGSEHDLDPADYDLIGAFEHQHPRGRHRRDDLFATGLAPLDWSASRRQRSHSQGDRSSDHTV